MTDFKVKFRGVRGSFPVADKRFLKYGGNTSCVEVNVGGHLIILDAGTGIVSCGDELMEKYISSGLKVEERTPIKALILISHIHQDHLLGLTFFKPMHLKSTILDIYGPGAEGSDLSEELKTLVFGRTFPLDLGDIACECNIHNINDECAILLKPNQKPMLGLAKDIVCGDEDVLITFYKSYVHPQEGVMIYKISYKGKSLVYATDKESYFGGDKNFVNFAKDCDVLIHDSQYTTEDYLNSHSPKQGYGHSTFDMAIESMKMAKAKQLVFFHYDPGYDDDKLNDIQELSNSNYPNVHLSYEGMEINLI